MRTSGCSCAPAGSDGLSGWPTGGFQAQERSLWLIWKERIGFVTLAAAFGYPIVPFASLGADESLHIAADGPDIMSSPIGKLLLASGIAEKYLRGEKHCRLWSAAWG